MRDETKCLHEGYTPRNGEPGVMPIVQSTTYRFDSTEQIGDLFNLTRERVRQIKEKAIRKLKKPSASKLLKTYLG